ncbi:MAG: hypothetical protein WA979_07690 [Pacificimonas sp.]
MSKRFILPLAALATSTLAACDSGDTPSGETTAEAEEAAELGPEAVIEAYYDALGRRDYDTAWQLWGKDAGTDPDAFEAFKDGFENTELTTAEIGALSAPETANGFLTVSIPVRVEDLLSDGTGRSYTGSYTLRRSSGETGGWHISAGDLNVAPATVE